MQTTETKTREESYTTVTLLTCDCCGKEAPYPNSYNGYWTANSYDVNHVTMQHNKGYSCPEGANWEESSYDICPDCWENKIVPLMNKEFDAKLSIKLVDF